MCLSQYISDRYDPKEWKEVSDYLLEMNLCRE